MTSQSMRMLRAGNVYNNWIFREKLHIYASCYLLHTLPVVKILFRIAAHNCPPSPSPSMTGTTTQEYYHISSVRNRRSHTSDEGTGGGR